MSFNRFPALKPVDLGEFRLQPVEQRTDVGLLPIAEHPYYPSWGYQVTGYYAVSSRYGSPEDFMYFIDQCHQNGIGVILDWVPGHFPTDAHGLVHFDGTPLYEHASPMEGWHPDWQSYVFNYGRHEVRVLHPLRTPGHQRLKITGIVQNALIPHCGDAFPCPRRQ